MPEWLAIVLVMDRGAAEPSFGPISPTAPKRLSAASSQSMTHQHAWSSPNGYACFFVSRAAPVRADMTLRDKRGSRFRY
jgi:hypothetical protein